MHQGVKLYAIIIFDAGDCESLRTQKKEKEKEKEKET